MTADKRGHVGWRWLILPTSPSGTWRITTTCRRGPRSGKAARSVVVVTASTKARGSVGDPTSLTTTEGATAGFAAGACGPFTPGQTCLAYRKRKDVYDTAVARGVPRGGPRPPGRGFSVWDGGQWLVNAKRAGLPTGSHPAAGALVVWGVANGASFGRVAYVEQATSDTHVLVTECSFDWTGRCRTVWRNPRAIAHLQGYIYEVSRVGGPGGVIIGGPGIGPNPPVNTVPPLVTGTAAVGTTLSAATGTWTSPTAIVYTYLWQRSPDGATGWVSATGAGAARSVYTVATTDAGQYLRVAVLASSGGGSASAASVAKLVAPFNTSPPTVSGTGAKGQVLTAGDGTWASAVAPTFAYQWQMSPSGAAPWANAKGAGATSKSYTPVQGDAGKHLRVVVTSTNPAGAGVRASSATGVVTAPKLTVALWHMNETGSGMADSAGSHNGTRVGAIINDPLGFTGSAFGFNGSTSHVLVPNADDLNPGALDITITIHVKTTFAPASPDWDLIRKGLFTSDGGLYKVEFQPPPPDPANPAFVGGQASCGFTGSNGSSEIFSNGPGLADGVWHTITCKKTSSSISLTVDGTTYSQGANVGWIANTDQVPIGARPGSEFFHGSLDEASITVG